MQAGTITCLTQVSHYLQISLGTIFLNEDNIPVCTLDGKDVKGFVNIMSMILRKTSNGLTPEEDAQLRQWFEYSFTYASRYGNTQNTNQILQELHCVLATRSYLVGNTLTAADLVMFYTLQNLIEKLSYLEKEKYLNVSRWYDNIQRINSVRQNKPLVDFSTISLAVR